MRFLLSVAILLQAALLFATLEQAPTALATFEHKRVAKSEDDAAVLDRRTISSDPTAPKYEISSPSWIPGVFENADDTVLVARSNVDQNDEDDDEEEDDDYDELEIITVFLPNEEEVAEGALQRRASPTLCPPNATVRRSSAVQTNANAKRANVAVTTTRTKTVTVTKTIYETVYRRCTQFVQRATTTKKPSSTKRATSTTKKRSTTTTTKKASTTKKTTTTKKASTTKKAASTSKKTTSSRKTTSTSKPATTFKAASTRKSSTSTTSTSIPAPATTKSSSSTTSKAATTMSTSKSTTSKAADSTSSTTTTSKPATTKSTSTSTTSSKASSTSTTKTTTSTPSSTSTTKTSTSTSTTSSKASSTTRTTSSKSSTATTTSMRTTTTSQSSTSTSSTTTTSSVPTPKVYSLMANYAGNNFYKNMYFFTFKDPTNGLVDYIGQEEASSLGMVKTTSGGQVYMGYATTRIYPTTSSKAPVTTKTSTSTSSSATTTVSLARRATTSSRSSSRSTSTSSKSTSTTAAATPYMKAIRVSSFDTFTTGVFILDASHMPVGCGTWPAWWTVPTNPAGGWPNGGEIDIVEGISYTSQNTYSVHTAHGCTVNSTNNAQLGSYQLQNKTLATNCASMETSNQGCGVQSSLANDFGVNYNSMGGGIHAMVWDADLGIKSYFWKRSKVPDDITAGTPDPSTWGTPQGSWPAANCDPNTFFFNHVSVFTNTICGDWAGNDYLWQNALAGQTQSCAAKTGFSTCKAYVQSAKVDFSDAYWLINSVKIYQTKRMY